MQTWTHKKVLNALLTALDKFSHAVSHEGSHLALTEMVRFETELMRRLDISDDEHRKTYKNGYDQGRFDEAADTINGHLGEMKWIGSGVGSTTFRGKLPNKNN